MPDGVFTVSPVNDFIIATTKAGARGAIDAASLADITALNDKFDHVPMDITSFSVDIPIAQKGATLTSLTFNWAVNKVPVEQYLNSVSISNSITSLVKAVSITADTTYTLLALDGTSYSGNSDSASVTVRFQQKEYYGVNSSSTGLTSSQIIALANKPFATSRQRTFTIAGAGQYIYIAYPASFGDATFKVNGFNNTSFTKYVMSFTNESGFAESYFVYRTNDIQTGTLEIQVL